jgi:putative oxidoreductase
MEDHVMNVSKVIPIAFLIGRLLVGGVYLWAGIDNLVDLNGKVGYAASKGMPNAEIFVLMASLLLLVAGFSILAGYRPNVGVIALVLFLIPVTFIMHNFWALQGLESTIELHNFQGNVALLGSGLIFLAIPQPWPISLDKWVGSSVSRKVEPQTQNTV